MNRQEEEAMVSSTDGNLSRRRDELYEQLALARSSLDSALSSLERASGALSKSGVGSHAWLEASSAVASAHLAVVNLQGGTLPDGRTRDSQILRLERQLQALESQEARAKVSARLEQTKDQLLSL